MFMAIEAPPEGKRWASVREAATYSGLSEKTIRRFIASGNLSPYWPLPGRVVVDLRDLDALITGSTVAGKRGAYLRKRRAQA
jgi:hypothetical protein